MDADLSSLPDDIDALKAALIAARTEAAAEKACAVAAVAELAQGRALIAHLNLEIEKLRRTIFGPRSERTARLLDQLELQLEEAEADAAEDELADFVYILNRGRVEFAGEPGELADDTILASYLGEVA